MKRKLLSGFLAAAMLSVSMFMLTACNEETTATGTGGASGEGTGGGAQGGDTSEETTGGPSDEELALDKFYELQGDVAGREILNVYTFTKETVEDLLPLFLKKNPNNFTDDFYINVEMAADHAAHRLAVNTKLGDNGGPDVFVADVDYAMEFAGLSGTASIDEIGIEINEDDYYDYVLDLMRKGDKIMGLSHQATPGGMYYRADIAEEVLGVKSEEEMQALVNDWDGFLEVAEKITEATELKMIYGADELKRNFLNTRSQGWVDDNGVFTVDEDTINEFVRVTSELKSMDALRHSGTGQWSDGWFRGMGTNDPVFSYFGSTWYLHFTIKGNAKKGGTYGKWGMVPGPAPFYWGGTYWFASKESLKDDAKATAIKDIIEFFCVNEDDMEAFAKKTGDFVSNKKIVEKIKNDKKFENDFFLWKTNHYEVFAEIADDIDITKNITKYDGDLDDYFSNFITNVFAEEMSVAEAIGKMKESVKAGTDIKVV